MLLAQALAFARQLVRPIFHGVEQTACNLTAASLD
jgi:hypothetical protein